MDQASVASLDNTIDCPVSRVYWTERSSSRSVSPSSAFMNALWRQEGQISGKRQLLLAEIVVQ